METTTDPITSDAVAERRPLTVLQVIPALETGGAERGAVDIAAALTAAGWRAVVASSGGQMEHELERVGARHVTLPLARKSPFVIRANIDRLAMLIEVAGVDLVHARSRAPAWSALYAARRTGRPFVTTFHSPYSSSNRLKHWYNSVMARGDRVIAISHFVGTYIGENYRVKDQSLRIVPRGIDLAVFDPAQVSAGRLIALTEAWRLPDGMPVVMMPARLTRWKGHIVLIEALALLGRKDVRCLLVGSDQGRRDYRLELERLCRARGLESVIHVTDHCRDMPAAYMLADVVVSASLEPEGFGRVIVEAQAMGRPVIATDHGAARETVIPGVSGWLTPPGDARALADALERALTLDTSARETLAAEAIPRVRAAYSKQTMCERTLAIYRELIDERTRGRVGAAS